jgi:phosphate:Na+ symporter
MISFKIDPIAPLFIFIGLVLHLFVKKRSVKNLGLILLGFGVLFFGITVMGGPLKAFAKEPGFQSILTTFRSPILSLLAGMVFTAIIQSSSATTGIVVALYLGGVDLPFTTAAFLVLGSNIGTCITAMLASITASRESKRAALSHVLFNTFGCIIVGALIAIFPGILTWIQQTWLDGARQVAMFHTLFNVSTVILLVPFIKQLAWLVQKIIPEKQGENDNAKRLIYLDPGIMQTPAIAVAQAHRELCRMGEMAKNNLRLALEAFYEKDVDKGAAALEVEDTLNFLNHQITAWLVRIRGLDLSDPDLEKLSLMLRTVSDIERVGDHAENIAEYAMLEGKYATKFSAAAMQELRAMSETALQLVALALEIFETYEEALLPQVDPLERVVDRMAKDFVEAHIKRLKAGDCDPRSGVVFTDMVTDLERCADHATNIAYSILGEKLRTAG